MNHERAVRPKSDQEKFIESKAVLREQSNEALNVIESIRVDGLTQATASQTGILFSRLANGVKDFLDLIESGAEIQLQSYTSDDHSPQPPTIT
jgi:hypothetical protein